MSRQGERKGHIVKLPVSRYCAIHCFFLGRGAIEARGEDAKVVQACLGSCTNIQISCFCDGTMKICFLKYINIWLLLFTDWYSDVQCVALQDPDCLHKDSNFKNKVDPFKVRFHFSSAV